IWLALLFASAGVFHHAGIKIPFFAFFAQDAGIRVKEPPLNMLLAMGLAAGLCIFIGVYPWLLYSWLPAPVEYIPYEATHVIAQLQLLFFSALAFCWLKLSGLYPPELPSVNLDAEWVYRRLGPRAVQTVTGMVQSVVTQLRTQVSESPLLRRTAMTWKLDPTRWFTQPWPTGSMVLWAVGLLGLILVSYYLHS
ncbi:MAG: hypothetical protein V3S25_05820, partial [Nitrospirales bacterium]